MLVLLITSIASAGIADASFHGTGAADAGVANAKAYNANAHAIDDSNANDDGDSNNNSDNNNKGLADGGYIAANGDSEGEELVWICAKILHTLEE